MSKWFLLINCIVLLWACQQNPKVRPGTRVLITYQLTNQKGRVIDQTGFMNQKMPLLLHAGQHEIFEPIDHAIIGMQAKQTKSIQIPTSAAFGKQGVFYLSQNQDTVFVVRPGERLKARICVLKIMN
jgi:FKBP-type peptidyl-prolyl cis-trans isomerase 2